MRSTRLAPKVPVEVAEVRFKDRPGMKRATVGTTLYLLPAESKRLRRLALEMDVWLHELLLRCADRLLAENGQRSDGALKSDLADGSVEATAKSVPAC